MPDHRSPITDHYFVHVYKALEVHSSYQTQWMAVDVGVDTNQTLSTAGIVMRVPESLKIPIVLDRKFRWICGVGM